MKIGDKFRVIADIVIEHSDRVLYNIKGNIIQRVESKNCYYSFLNISNNIIFYFNEDFIANNPQIFQPIPERKVKRYQRADILGMKVKYKKSDTISNWLVTGEDKNMFEIRNYYYETDSFIKNFTDLDDNEIEIID